jgi:hypothetical protein
VVAAFLLAAGCSPGDDVRSARSPVRFQTSVDGDRRLDALTDDENAALCLDYQSAQEAFARNPELVAAGCRLRAEIAVGEVQDRAQARAACHQEYDACLAELAAKPVPVATCPNQRRTCSATVDDFAACMNAELDLVAYYIELAPDCDHFDPDPADHDVTDDGSFDAMLHLLTAPCAAYNQKCPS